MEARVVADDAVLRSRAVEVSVGRDCFRSLHEVWCQLTRGDCTIADAFTNATTCYLVLTAPVERPPPINPSHLQILERVLQGSEQKTVALDYGLSCSTIATVAKQTLAILGLDCLPSRAPLALVVVAQASNARRAHWLASVGVFQHSGREHQVVSVQRPDWDLASLLPPSEVEVLRARIEGHTHQKIAGLRRTSKRTIANQLASASRRLGVSGRLEIIGRLVLPHRDAAAPPR
jgi:DNA-binding NarL/FixJ family response regulator